MKKVVDVITMGCSKNLVDSEQLLHLFRKAGFRIYHNPETLHGGTAVVNTCGFIGDAKEESINMILDLVNRKEEGEIEQVFVMGCLSERYRQELHEEIPQVDRFYGKFDWRAMLTDLVGDAVPTCGHERVLTTPQNYAYVKISEGCDRHCAYCAIPLMTGHHISRPMEEILQEVTELVNRGVHEFQVIAQELTYYGLDLYGYQRIAELVEAMARIPGVEWIRLHYAYPNAFPLDLLRVMRENDNVCKYLDIALQHINDNVLSRMRRNTSRRNTIALLHTIRREVPGICLRTTLMVGFPGETESEFRELLEFVRDTRFERMGAFAYSEEEGTYAAEHYEDDVPDSVKQQRLDQLMGLQEEIAAEIAAERVGKCCRVVVDREEGDYYVCRSEWDSPEVDCEVLIPRQGNNLQTGCFYNVRITDAEEFDLYATPVH